MRKFIGAVISLVVVAGVGVAGVNLFVGEGRSLNPLTDAANSARTAASNVVLDTSGIKEKAETLLNQHSDTLAAVSGLGAAEINAAIESLDITDWQAATVPEDAQETGTYGLSYEGVSGSITTYDDPSVVTVEAYGQEITLQIPEGAQETVQEYLPYLSLLTTIANEGD